MKTHNLLQHFIFIFSLLFINVASNAQPNEVTYQGVNITDFTVSVIDNKININWSTDNAIATNYFVVQKSTDGVHYKTILMVLGADPKKSSCDCYGCFDKFVRKVSKRATYRLVHVNTDGTEQISEAKQVAFK